MRTKFTNLLVVVALLVSLVAVAIPVSVGAASPDPETRAGPDQLVTMGDTVTMDASASYDLTDPPEGLNFQWSLVSGPNSPVLSPNPQAEVVTFTAAHGIYVYKVEVTAGGDMTSDTVTIVAGGETWYVAIGGGNGNPGTSWATAWRTITHAVTSPLVVHGDTIMVGDGTYGGPGGQECIVVDKAITIRSLNGYDWTTINVGTQSPCSPTLTAVVEITTPSPVLDLAYGVVFPPVVLDGFTLTGAGQGVDAHDSDFVEILNNKVMIPDDGVGIGVDNSKFPIIDHNRVEVGNVGSDFAVGIWVTNSLGAIVTDNTVNVFAGSDPCAFVAGIIVCESGKSLIQYNVVTATIGGDAVALGILAYDSPWVEVLDNTVDIPMNAFFFGAAFGISVLRSDWAEVLRNIVDVDASVLAEWGGTIAVGIDVWMSDFAEVSHNNVEVDAYGQISSQELALTLDQNVLLQLGPLGTQMADVGALRFEALQDVTEELLGIHPDALGGALAIGIWVGSSESPLIYQNDPVDVYAEVSGTAYDEQTQSTGIMGIGLALGIIGTSSPGTEVEGNLVTADAYGDLKAMDEDMEFRARGAFAYGLGVTAGLGIVLLNCPPYVLNVHGLPAQVATSTVLQNSVRVNGTLRVKALAESLTILGEGTDSLVPEIESVLQVVYEIVDQTLEDEEVGGSTAGDPQPLHAFSSSLGAGIGIGILTIMSPGVQVLGNNPVSGTGNMTVVSVSVDMVVQDFAQAWGAGLGLGAGIVSMFCPGTVISGNNVTGSGYADALVGAAQIPITLYAGGFGGGAGVGLGIMGISAPNAMITDNMVQADGEAWVLVGAYEGLTGQQDDAEAYGAGIGAGIGVAVTLSPDSLVAGNTVTASGLAKVAIGAETITVEDPWVVAMGGGVGAGIAIMAVLSDRVVITDNTVKGIASPGAKGEADVFAYAREDWMFMHDYNPQDAMAHAGALGVGMGIVVAMSDHAQVSSSQEEVQEVVARGSARVVTYAGSLVPLAEAWNAGLAVGKGIALVVFSSHGVEVGPCNILDGAGEAFVLAIISGDPLQVDVAIAVGIDALFLATRHSSANYNSFVGVGGSTATAIGVPAEYSVEMELVFEAGLVVLGVHGLDLDVDAQHRRKFDARYNWWADPTGPSGVGPGNGQPLIGHRVKYEPWLYVIHTVPVAEHIGKFGFAIPLHKCWNTFSTPIALEERVDTWGELLAFSGATGDVDIAYWWDLGGQTWLQVLNADAVEPLYGMYLKMNKDSTFLLLVTTMDVLPTRDLVAGWNLFGPNPPFFDGSMYVEDAVSPIAGEPGEGFAFVISPAVGTTQESWVWSGAPGIPDAPCLLSGLAYWVWMDTADTLAGMGHTPVRNLYPPTDGPCNWGGP